MKTNYAVLIIDIQNDYCHPKGKMAKAGKSLSWLQNTSRKIKEFVDEIKKINIPVFYIKTSVERNSLSEYEKIKQKKHSIYGICEKDSWGADLYLLKPSNKDIIIDKQHYSAFFDTSLSNELKKLNIDNLIIIGTSTHICVDSTVRDAYQNGYNVIVIRDLVATREEEKRFHNSTLELIEKQFGRVIHSEEILKLIIAKTKTQGDAVLSSLRSSPFHNKG